MCFLSRNILCYGFVVIALQPLAGRICLLFNPEGHYKQLN